MKIVAQTEYRRGSEELLILLDVIFGIALSLYPDLHFPEGFKLCIMRVNIPQIEISYCGDFHLENAQVQAQEIKA